MGCRRRAAGGLQAGCRRWAVGEERQTAGSGREAAVWGKSSMFAGLPVLVRVVALQCMMNSSVTLQGFTETGGQAPGAAAGISLEKAAATADQAASWLPIKGR